MIPVQQFTSQFAGTAVVPPQGVKGPDLDKRELIKGTGITVEGAKDMAWEMAEQGVPIPGIAPLTYAAAVPISMMNADRKFDKAMQKICDDYRPEIAAKLGIPPQRVDPSMLYLVADKIEPIRSALAAFDSDRKTHPMTNMAGVGGMAASAAAGVALGTAILPIGGSLIGGLAGAMVGFEGGKKIGAHLLGVSDNTNPVAVMDMLKEKHGKNEMITAKDIFALRVAQHPSLGEYIEHQYEKAFHAMETGEQLAVLQEMKPITQACAQDAACCNHPQARLEALMFGRMPANDVAAAQASGGWIARTMQGAGQSSWAAKAAPANDMKAPERTA